MAVVVASVFTSTTRLLELHTGPTAWQTTQMMASILEHVALNNATAQRSNASEKSYESNVDSELGIRRRSRPPLSRPSRCSQTLPVAVPPPQSTSRTWTKQTHDESETTETIRVGEQPRLAFSERNSAINTMHCVSPALRAQGPAGESSAGRVLLQRPHLHIMHTSTSVFLQPAPFMLAYTPPLERQARSTNPKPSLELKQPRPHLRFAARLTVPSASQSQIASSHHHLAYNKQHTFIHSHAPGAGDDEPRSMGSPTRPTLGPRQRTSEDGADDHGFGTLPPSELVPALALSSPD
ncbi:hypothetical protein BKA62DRAFT_675230 [Auriculariales sp. MPI-PUGE-AT-0066]|nr:hypothetical protein BKA62DRAFT_675230 [Auriculariales sp. MPI-PUGE-AT-0066]